LCVGEHAGERDGGCVGEHAGECVGELAGERMLMSMTNVGRHVNENIYVTNCREPTADGKIKNKKNM
jgi:hypothetical protein